MQAFLASFLRNGNAVPVEGGPQLRLQQLLRKSTISKAAAAAVLSNETVASKPRSAPPTEEERAAMDEKRKQWTEERRERAREKIKSMPPPPKEQLKILSREEIMKIKERNRNLNWFNGNEGGSEGYSMEYLADPSQYYDKWQQAYRMLGGFIDCDHNTGEGSGSGGDNGGDAEGACSRWMMWAAVSGN